MILLDTNVISEMMRASPSPIVRSWMNSFDTATLFVTSVTLAELAHGWNILPDGRRKAMLGAQIDQVFDVFFLGRVLGFDDVAARAYGEVKAARKALGRPISDFDAQIASISRTQYLSLATRNIRDFEGIGLDLINPFDA
jgi:predicted nucleic acid-binding protein